MSSTPRLELENVGLAFGNHRLFSSLNLKVFSGEKFVMIGPSGGGKTSLLKILAGILPPTEGKVLVDGVDFYAAPEQERQKVAVKMGMLFQKNALFDSMSCADNVGFPMREVSDLSEGEIQKKIDFLLEEVGIAHAKSLFPDEISGGMQKRLGIARALTLNPEIIFYDDPTAGLDPITSRKIVDLISAEQVKNKATVVAITNEIARAYQLADRIAFVHKGRVLITGNSDETSRHKDPLVHQFIRGSAQGPLTDSV